MAADTKQHTAGTERPVRRSTALTGHLLRVSVVMWLSLTCAWISASARAQEVELRRYVVQQGDTCSGIARRVYGDSRRYDLIHVHNPDLGSLPHHLEPGRVLMIPTAGEAPDATLTEAVRRVQAQPPEAEQWQAAQQGLGLYRGWRVNTLERAAAEVTFRDTSALYMRENTLVVIFGGIIPRTNRRDQGAYVERGALRSFLGDLRLRVQTRTSEVRLRGGEALVDVDDDHESRLSNFEGGNAALSSVTGGTVFVRPGYGSKVRVQQRPSRPRPLPPSPDWSEGTPRRFASLAGRGGSVVAAWQAVEPAVAYRVELALDEQGKQVVVAARVPAAVTRFEAHFLPPATYYARVSSIDDERFESRPSVAVPLELLSMGVREPGQREVPTFDPGDPSRLPTAPTVMIGSVLQAPEGGRCAGPRQGPASRLLLTHVGRQTLRCSLSDGSPLADLELVVERPVLSLETELAEVMPGGGAQTLTVNASHDLALLPLTVESGPCLAASALELSDQRSATLRITAPPGCSGQQHLRFLIADHEAGHPTNLLTRHLHVASSPPPQPAEHTDEADSDPASRAPLAWPGTPRSVDLGARWHRGSLAETTVSFLGGTRAASARVVRLGVSAQAGLWEDRVSLSLAYQRDLLSDGEVSRGARALTTGGAYHLRPYPGVDLSLGLNGDLPTGQGDSDVRHLRLRPVAQGSVALSSAWSVQALQGAVFGLGQSDAGLWSSSYALLLRPHAQVALQAGCDLAIGRLLGESFTGAGAQFGAALTAGTLQLALAGHVALTDDFMRRFGRLGLAGTAAVLF